ncbi:MFS transporter [Mycolicibacterium sp. PAM1]|uniref:MFS transporter n=1 Tax=Mycolicibacterium sp. PAM1 TaxID=2853535 RepID=UPI001C3CA317|nr:MFS transporter [Mycolicibacterium sp. PAM1]MBV5242825.1 MFS transporter [Mycolicibacterium sp. PAM1]
MAPSSIGPTRRWLMLAIGLLTTLCANVFINGVAFLIPTLHDERGLDLAGAALMSSLPSLGMVFSEHGWSPESAGVLVMVAQIMGAAGRIGAGRWSDHYVRRSGDLLASRLRPIRIIAAAAAASMALLALTDLVNSPLSIALMMVASVITVSDNGLAFTLIAEYAGPFWSGRALGTQNTSQLFAQGVAPPLFGGLIAVAGYPVAFAVCALLPVLAIPAVPLKVTVDR